jgi:hypothetical protein
MKPVLVIALVVMAAMADQAPSAPQTGPPSTDVFVASLFTSSEAMKIGEPENISQGPGYDNQPFFAPDGASLFFTSDRAPRKSPTVAYREYTSPFDVKPDRYWPPHSLFPLVGASASAAAGAYARMMATIANEPPTRQSARAVQGASQMDIFRYDFKRRKVSRVTSTNESEYSPTVTPDGKFISVIRVEADGTQRLWKFRLNGKDPKLVLENVKPVGYHSWLDGTTLALFVLGQPATLQLADTTTGKAEIVASNIGQSIQKIPGGGVSFVQQAGQGAERTFTITQLTVGGGSPVTTPLTPAVPGSTQVHVTWTPNGTLLMAHDGALYAWNKGDTTWRVVADLKALGLKNVTRLAVSPRGDKLALVAAQ